MPHSFASINGVVSFTVTKSNPSGTIVKFDVGDSTNLLTDTKMIKAVLCDAIQQWIDAERADLDANGDQNVKGAEEYPGVGDGFSEFYFDFGDKAAFVELTSTSSISTTGTLTASIPFADAA